MNSHPHKAAASSGNAPASSLPSPAGHRTAFDVGPETIFPFSNGPWTVLKRNCVYQDPWLTTFQDDVIRPDKLSGSYSTSHVKPGVCVIAMDENRVVHLTREFHYAVGRITIEGVSGGIEDGESAEQTALRELVEEIGAVASKLTPLGITDPLTSALRSPTRLFLATQIEWVPPSPEGTETIERQSIGFEQAVEMVMESQITHAPTCLALLKIRLLECGNKLP